MSDPTSGEHTLSDTKNDSSTSSDTDGQDTAQDPPVAPQHVGGSQSQGGNSQSQGGTSAESLYKLKNASVRIIGNSWNLSEYLIDYFWHLVFMHFIK